MLHAKQGLTVDWCRFCSILNFAKLACWTKLKIVQNLHQSKVTPLAVRNTVGVTSECMGKTFHAATTNT